MKYLLSIFLALAMYGQLAAQKVTASSITLNGDRRTSFPQVYEQSSAPTGGTYFEGDMWIDTNSDSSYVYNGGWKLNGIRAGGTGDTTAVLRTDVNNLQTLSGRPDGSTHNGTYTGTTITDNQSTKQNIQQLETAVETKLTDGTGVVTSAKILDGTIATGDIANDAITNAKMANMAASTIKGNNTGSSGDPVDMTVAQAKTLLAYIPTDITGLTEFGKNKIDTTLVLAGLFFNNADGNVNGGGGLFHLSGKQAVTPNTAYVLWNNSSEALHSFLHFFNSSGVWIGNNSTLGVGSQTGSGVNSIWTFTTPATCYYIGVNSGVNPTQTISQFRNSLQLEKTSKTSYQTPKKVLAAPYNSDWATTVYVDAKDLTRKAYADSLHNAQATTLNAYSDLRNETMKLSLADTLPWNVIKGEGTSAITAGPIPQSLGSIGFTSSYIAASSAIPNYARLKYQRRIVGNVSSGNAFWVTSPITWPATKPTKFGLGFWVKDTQIDTIFPGSTTTEFWIYEGGLRVQPIFAPRTVIAAVGNSQTANFTASGMVSGTWTAKCLDKRNGYSFISLNFTSLVWNGGYAGTTFTFYHYMNPVAATLNGHTLDYIGFTWLWGDEVASSSVHPDGGAVRQYPLPSEAVLNKEIADVAAINATLSTKQTQAQVLSLIDSVGATMIVLKDGSNLHIRTRYNGSQDLIQTVSYLTSGVINFGTVRVISNSAPNTTVAYAAGELISGGGDDAAPLQINGTYIGANHGCSDLRVVTATSHGKITADVGSRWADSGSRNYFLVKVVDVNNLWFMSIDTIGGDLWGHRTTLTGNLSHVSGATNTATITVASVTGGQLIPAVKNVANSFLLNGKKAISADGLYRCNWLDVVNNYDIIDPSNAVLYLSTHIGTTDLTRGDTVAGNNILYRFDDLGTCQIIHGWRNYKAVNLSYMGFTQVGALSTATHPNRKFYLPRSLPIGGKDFRNIENWDTAIEASLTDTYWADANEVPERAIAYISTGSTLKHALAHGYVPTRGIGVDTNRLANVNVAWYLYTSGKSYPHGIDSELGNPLAANTWKSAFAYRSYFDAQTSNLGTKSGFYFFEVGKEVLVFVDYHASVSFDNLTLPAKYVGMSAEVVYKSASLTLHTPEVTQKGLSVSVTSSGYGCFKLY